MSGQARPRGRNIEGWDGRDDAGRLAPRDTYSYRGVLNPNTVRASYEFAAGDPGTPDPESPYDFLKYQLRTDTLFTWRDTNGNEIAEEAEVTRHENSPPVNSNWGSFVDKDMNIYVPDFFDASPPRAIHKYPLSGFDPRGNPIYDPSRPERILEGAFRGEFPIWVTPTGEIYAADAEILPPPPSGQTLEPAWGGIGSTADVKLMKFDARRNLVWQTGRKNTREAQPASRTKSSASPVSNAALSFLWTSMGSSGSIPTMVFMWPVFWKIRSRAISTCLTWSGGNVSAAGRVQFAQRGAVRRTSIRSPPAANVAAGYARVQPNTNKRSRVSALCGRWRLHHSIRFV